MPWWAVPPVVVVVLLAGEVGARVIGPRIPRVAGTEERLFVKADQIVRRGPDSTDVVVLGSSETAGGVIPRLVQGELDDLEGVYNAALSGSDLGFMREWATRIVVPRLRPKVALIGILPMSVMEIDAGAARGPERALRAYSSAIDQVDPGGLGSVTWHLRQHSGLIRYRAQLRSPTSAARGVWAVLRGDDGPPLDDRPVDWTKETDPRRIARSTAPDGEVFDYRDPSVPTAEDPIGARLYELFGRSEVDLAPLDALVDDLRAHGVEPVVLVGPVDRAPLEAAGADLAPLDRVARRIEAWGRARGVPVDQRFTEDWPQPQFHDRNHVSLAGARRWSRLVGARLQALCDAGALRPACP